MAAPSTRTFRHTIRVPYAHVDRMAVVYYANYFIYFEMARSEMLREAGTPYPEMEKRGIILPVVSAHCDYKRPAHYDELLVVLSRCSIIRGIRLHIDYEIRRFASEARAPDAPASADEGELLATGYTEHVGMSREGRVLRAVPELRKLL